ncbi:hypothetical protein BH11ARM2_BH11ARM2_11790 [soil metagenome]
MTVTKKLQETQRLRPASDADLRKIESALVVMLDSLTPLVTQKVRRQTHSELMIDISCAWMGANEASEGLAAIVDALPRAELPADLATARETSHDRAELQMAGTVNDRRFYGRIVLVT